MTECILVKRSEKSSCDTSEVRKLASSTGYTIFDEIKQVREEDPQYNIGRGLIPTIHHEINRTGVDTVIIDNELDPEQKYNIGVYLENDVDIKDINDILLEFFSSKARTKESQLQVELAEQKYELPRVEMKKHLSNKEEHPGFMGLGEYDKVQKEHIKKRIKNLQEELDKYTMNNRMRREERKNRGFDLVTIAGYTNAGKSSLLRRLSENHSLDEIDDTHPDIVDEIDSSNRYFTTLNTKTRKMDYDKRDVLLTDTIGFFSKLPDFILSSFESTLDSVYSTELILLVVDVSDDLEKIKEKVTKCHDIMYGRTNSPIVTVLNKSDLVSQKEIEIKKKKLDYILDNPVQISVKENENIEKLKEVIDQRLPSRQEKRIKLDWNEMSTLSWIHDNTYVKDQKYMNDGVCLDIVARSEKISKVHSRIGPKE